MVYFSHSEKETFAIAQEFARGLKGGEVIALSGDLGAGKTVFAKGVGRALDVKELITSPTFTIIKEYQGRLKLNHADLYRLDEEGAQSLGLTELYASAVTLIEWASNAPTLLPKHHYKVDIEVLSEGERKITIGRQA